MSTVTVISATVKPPSSTSNAAPSSSGTQSPTSSDSGSSTGLIVGIVVGSLVVVCLLVVFLVPWVRRRRHSRSSRSDLTRSMPDAEWEGWRSGHARGSSAATPLLNSSPEKQHIPTPELEGSAQTHETQPMLDEKGPEPTPDRRTRWAAPLSTPDAPTKPALSRMATFATLRTVLTKWSQDSATESDWQHYNEEAGPSIPRTMSPGSESTYSMQFDDSAHGMGVAPLRISKHQRALAIPPVPRLLPPTAPGHHRSRSDSSRLSVLSTTSVLSTNSVRSVASIPPRSPPPTGALPLPPVASAGTLRNLPARPLSPSALLYPGTRRVPSPGPGFGASLPSIVSSDRPPSVIPTIPSTSGSSTDSSASMSSSALAPSPASAMLHLAPTRAPTLPRRSSKRPRPSALPSAGRLPSPVPEASETDTPSLPTPASNSSWLLTALPGSLTSAFRTSVLSSPSTAAGSRTTSIRTYPSVASTSRSFVTAATEDSAEREEAWRVLARARGLPTIQQASPSSAPPTSVTFAHPPMLQPGGRPGAAHLRGSDASHRISLDATGRRMSTKASVGYVDVSI